MANAPATSDTTTSPPLIISQDQAKRLSALADGALDRLPDLAGRLLDELERAQVLPDAEVPADVVGMGNEVVFRDEASQREHSVTLVYPADADIDAGRISILTPVGTGLIGLRVGQWIDWPMANGAVHRLRIIAVKR